MQFVKTCESLPPSQAFKSEIAKSLVQNNVPQVKNKPSNEKEHDKDKPITKIHTTQSADNQSWLPSANQNSSSTQFHPARVNASTETFENRNENIQPQVPIPEPPPPQPLLQPKIVVTAGRAYSLSVKMQ